MVRLTLSPYLDNSPRTAQSKSSFCKKIFQLHMQLQTSRTKSKWDSEQKLRLQLWTQNYFYNSVLKFSLLNITAEFFFVSSIPIFAGNWQNSFTQHKHRTIEMYAKIERMTFKITNPLKLSRHQYFYKKKHLWMSLNHWRHFYERLSRKGKSISMFA